MANVAALPAKLGATPEFAPLPILLLEGGDDRLAIDPTTGLNSYGCAPSPRAGVIAFSSSTASTISERAWRRASFARAVLRRELSRQPLAEALDIRVEATRRSLKTYLGLGDGEVVFSSSGTDSQLHAHTFVRMLMSGPLTTIVVGADQTGSGTAYTSRGCHFSRVTALGRDVCKGEPACQGGAADSTAIPLIGEDGQPRSLAEIDFAVIDAVGRAVASGRKVLLQTMESSKLGWRAPSDACVEAVQASWPDAVQVVVDACQWRSPPERLAAWLKRGAIVLITGSKFFMGPCFSGAALVPAALSRRLAFPSSVPAGITDYLARSDVPPAWEGLRQALPAAASAGPWLRWEAALEEIAAFQALPMPRRTSLAARLGNTMAGAIASSPALEPGPQQHAATEPPTVFPFFVKDRQGLLPHEALVRLYRALNSDMARALPASATAGEREIASRLCHIGQPVRLGQRSVLRMALGARNLTELAVQLTEDNCAMVVEKIDLLVRHGLTG